MTEFQNMKVRELMTRNVVSVQEEMSLKEVAEVMSYYRISGVIVLDKNKKPVGVISERNIVKALTEGANSSAKAREIMSTTFFTIDPNATIRDAAKIMKENRIRRLLVFPGGQGAGRIDRIPEGIISVKDIIRELALARARPPDLRTT